jgi:hypothetical protein
LWLHEYGPQIIAYLDPPKKLAELQEAARSSRSGYDRHHIVEQSARNQPGFPSWLIESRRILSAFQP